MDTPLFLYFLPIFCTSSSHDTTYRGGGAYDVDPSEPFKTALFFCKKKGASYMKNNEYRRCIVKMLEQVEDNNALKAIYFFVQKHFIK